MYVSGGVSGSVSRRFYKFSACISCVEVGSGQGNTVVTVIQKKNENLCGQIFILTCY